MKQDRESLLANQVPKIIINDNTVIPYPENELKSLKECLELNGFLKQCVDYTKVSAPTIKSYLLVRKGEFKKVNKVRAYVKAFLAAASEPIRATA